MSNRIEDLEIYLLAEKFGDQIWFIVMEWPYFVKMVLESRYQTQLIQSVQTLPKGLADITTRKTKTFVISAEARLLRQKDGSEKQRTEV